MNSPPGPASNTAATAHVAKYEEIRSYAVERLAFAGRHGLAVLLGQGLAAWIEQWSKIPEWVRHIIQVLRLQAEYRRPQLWCQR